jgi:hypothetical protein
MDEMQHTADVDLFEGSEAGMIEQLSAPGLLQGPPGL